MPFLVREVHGLSGLALAKAEPAGGGQIKAKEPPQRRGPQSRLTSDQVHVDQVRFDVSRLLWLVPQALQGETESQPQSLSKHRRERQEDFVQLLPSTQKRRHIWAGTSGQARRAFAPARPCSCAGRERAAFLCGFLSAARSFPVLLSSEIQHLLHLFHQRLFCFNNARHQRSSGSANRATFPLISHGRVSVCVKPKY